ncbi:hypothetical protein JKP88DRAFT_235166 [Tribonema minus]|uniref:Uncharacterized protein n=1 Tax=Tribonema minus TaxID=303371 RepID=A0A835Z7T7_9STRA|nr:hypothetical protein JKP88DRAFT_235166 [Tribonema minus]
MYCVAIGVFTLCCNQRTGEHFCVHLRPRGAAMLTSHTPVRMLIITVMSPACGSLSMPFYLLLPCATQCLALALLHIHTLTQPHTLLLRFSVAHSCKHTSSRSLVGHRRHRMAHGPVGSYMSFSCCCSCRILAVGGSCRRCAFCRLRHRQRGENGAVHAEDATRDGRASGIAESSPRAEGQQS